MTEAVIEIKTMPEMDALIETLIKDIVTVHYERRRTLLYLYSHYRGEISNELTEKYLDE
ncbi:MAG: hypothetical protein LBT30_06085 [Clostridiales bacterium]|jgi:hypothetical protein|nr:hypothetical protein [Clostridiales bacterium]